MGEQRWRSERCRRRPEPRMAKRSRGKSKTRIDWRAALVDPLVRQILALILTAVAVITLLTLFGVTSGRWADAWTAWLQL